MTERKKPRLDLTSFEWKLAISTLLAGGYVALWLGLEVPAPTMAPVSSPEPTFASAPRVVQSPVAKPRPRRIKTRSS